MIKTLSNVARAEADASPITQPRSRISPISTRKSGPEPLCQNGRPQVSLRHTTMKGFSVFSPLTRRRFMHV